VAETAAEAAVVIVWFIGYRGSSKDYWDYFFFLCKVKKIVKIREKIYFIKFIGLI